MSQTAPPESDFSPIGSLTEKSKNIQLAITGALVIFIVVIAGAALYVRYRPKSYKPNRVNVTTSIYLVDSKAAKATLALRNPTTNPNSKFVTMILNDAELKSLLIHNGIAAKQLTTDRRQIHMWRSQASSMGHSKIDVIKNSTDPRVAPVHVTTHGSLGGFLGTRLEEDKPMFRVQMSCSIARYGEKHDHLKGDLLYEGHLPTGQLVFLG